MQHLHPKAKWLLFFRYTLFAFLAAMTSLAGFWIVFLTTLSDMKDERQIFWTGLIFGTGNLLIALALFILALVLTPRAYENYKYKLTEKSLEIERGAVAKKHFSIPYEKIQNVDIHRGPLTRILGLSDLQVMTAGGSRFQKTVWGHEGRLLGLDPKVAEELREELITRAKEDKQNKTAFDKPYATSSS